MTDRVAFVVLMGLTLLAVAATAPPVVDGVQNAVLPGEESRSLDDLDPAFRAKLDGVIARLEEDGWPVWVRATRRDAARQAFYLAHGWSKAKTSRHQSGLAADLILPAPLVILPLHNRFFDALRTEARAAGLCSGGDYAQSAWPWRSAGLGWDPAHVEMKGKGGC